MDGQKERRNENVGRVGKYKYKHTDNRTENSVYSSSKTRQCQNIMRTLF